MKQKCLSWTLSKAKKGEKEESQAQNIPHSLDCCEHVCERSVLGLVLATQQVPEPRQKSSQGADRKIGVWWLLTVPWDPSCQGLGPKNPVNPWTKKTHSRTPQTVISPMGARKGPTAEKGLSQLTVPSLENQQVAHHTKQMMCWLCIHSSLAKAEYVTESKMSRHLEIQSFGRIKAQFTKTLFS